MEFRRLSAALGVEATGVDLSEPLPKAEFRRMRDAWIEATVLLIRGQRLPPKSQLEFAHRFGAIKNYVKAGNSHQEFPAVLVLSNLKQEGRPLGAPVSGRYWHTDGHYFREPPSASILHAIETPERGGETRFANMFAAYEALPEETKRRIEGLKVVISRVQSRPYNYPDRPPVSDADRAAWPDMPQPIVRTHPVSGRRALYVGGNVPWKIEGMPEAESVPLITMLQQFAVQPQFTYEHRWARGDVIVWDNRSAMHKATAYDEVNDRRHMHRVTVEGDLPF